MNLTFKSNEADMGMKLKVISDFGLWNTEFSFIKRTLEKLSAVMHASRVKLSPPRVFT